MDTASADKKKERAKFLYSREALLEHLEETEKVLKGKVDAFRPKDPYYQRLLIEKYLTLQDDLSLLKEFVTKSKSANPQPTGNPEEQWDDKKAIQELKNLLAYFENFLHRAGFIRKKENYV